jgi:hypothetical protein
VKQRGEGTDDILSVLETFLDLSSRDFLRAASFARLASRSARRRSAADMGPVPVFICRHYYRCKDVVEIRVVWKFIGRGKRRQGVES